MNVTVFSTKDYEQSALTQAETDFAALQLKFLEPRLTPETAPLAEGADAVCVFVHDEVNAATIATLARLGVKVIALRCAGFNNVDLEVAKAHGLTVCRVPAYSPAGVAEFAVTLLLALNRRIHVAYRRVRDGNFSLSGLMGFQLRGKTVGVVGTGKIGQAFAEAMLGFGCEVIAYDPYENAALREKGVRSCDLETLLATSHVISLHCPLTPESHHLINADRLAQMRTGALLINTSRGELVDTTAVIAAVKSGQLGGLGIDVYENEEGVFFEDLSNTVIGDDQLMRLTTFPNVIITSHQAFFTTEAMEQIAATTLANLAQYAEDGVGQNLVS